LEQNVLDQIIKFDYITSVFDIIVLSSIKSIILFILITELESFYKDLLFIQKKFEENDSELNLTTTVNEDSDDIEINVKYMGPEHLRYLISILHISILLLSIISSIYPIVKLSFIMNSFMKENMMPIRAIFFSVTITSLCFSLIQVLFSSLSWYFMKKLQNVELVKHDEENKNTKKINLKRLFSLSKPEMQPLFYGFLALLASSSTQIVTPYFFGRVIDSAEKYSDLSDMNFAVLLMFLIYVAGSIASGIRSWLFEYSGQRQIFF
jgi:hypothetical protein